MDIKILELDNIDIKVEVGSLLLNILYLRFVTPERIKVVGNHCHNSYELHYIPYGNGEVTVQGNTYALSPGNVYLTGPNIYHEQRGAAEDSMAEYCVNFEILKNKNYSYDRKYEHANKDMLIMEQILSNTFFWFGKDTYATIDLFDKILEEINNRYIGYYLNIKNYVNIIITNTIRCYSEHKISSETPPTKDITDLRRLIIDKYMQDSCKERSVNELADHVGLSHRQLNRTFTAYYGMTFHEKLTQMRMQNAAMYLVETDLPVKKIAEITGHDDYAYFCRKFKKQFSVTALEYRKNR